MQLATFFIIGVLGTGILGILIYYTVFRSEELKCWCCGKITLNTIQGESIQVLLCLRCVEKLFKNRQFKKNIANATVEVNHGTNTKQALAETDFTERPSGAVGKWVQRN